MSVPLEHEGWQDKDDYELAQDDAEVDVGECAEEPPAKRTDLRMREWWKSLRGMNRGKTISARSKAGFKNVKKKIRTGGEKAERG